MLNSASNHCFPSLCHKNKYCFSISKTKSTVIYHIFFPTSDKLKIQCKIRDEYSGVKNIPLPKETTTGQSTEQHKTAHSEQGKYENMFFIKLWLHR